MRYIFNKKHVFQTWEIEARRFKNLYRVIPHENLQDVVQTSTLNRIVLDYPPCMLIWMEAALQYFRHEQINIADVTIYTNQQLPRLKNMPLEKIWDELERKETELKQLLKKYTSEELLSDSRNWHWLVWCTFGHYDEHVRQLEWHFVDKKEKPPEEKWLNVYIME